jgi:drug/metabolite transporter (DMT)-like permease
MLGLLLCLIGAVFNVFTDASRKKVLDENHDAALVSLWCKIVAFGCYVVALGCLIPLGIKPSLPPIGASLNLSPAVAFAIYLTLNALLEGTAILLNYRALQVAPLSLCAPFLTLTAVFLLPVGKFFLHESISTGMVIGVFLVLIGSLAINRQLFANGWLEPAKAIIREKGSRYMTIVALLLTCTAALDKWFVTSGNNATFSEGLARALTLCIGKCVMLSLFLSGLTFLRLGDWKSFRAKSKTFSQAAAGIKWNNVWRDVPTWLILAGAFEAAVLVLQLTALRFTPVAVVLSIKRSGILLACVVGWFMFKERGITDRVIGSFVMLAGVLVFFLTKPGTNGQSEIGVNIAIEIALTALLGMAVALSITRKRNLSPAGATSARVAGLNLKPLSKDEA